MPRGAAGLRCAGRAPLLLALLAALFLGAHSVTYNVFIEPGAKQQVRSRTSTAGAAPRPLVPRCD